MLYSNPLLFLLISQLSGRCRRQFVFGSRTRLYSHNARLVNDLYVKVVHYEYLARKPYPVVQIGLGREDGGFILSDRAWVALEHLDTASRTPGVSAAAM